ncbi:MAG: WecB/TagA/CpsF family glycosyltransferase [Candidatus Riflebacteria bacterium]|nr:WecB/TagA/CpsF family glycosyltransferase [Candidatus Riflebacteria bacterium]
MAGTVTAGPGGTASAQPLDSGAARSRASGLGPPSALQAAGSDVIESRRVLATRVDAVDYDAASRAILQRARSGEPAYVCVATVHMLMEAHDSPEFQGVLERASLVTADGVPVVWALRLLGAQGATRVCGPELMPLLCGRAAAEDLPIGLFGGTPEVLQALQTTLPRQHEGLRIAFACSPPFREPTREEDAAVVSRILESGARLLFVGLGCPKQERWMAGHVSRLPLVQIGVGAAFDFLCGGKGRPPGLVQSAGFEWAYRLWCEPRRLWRRYLYHNPRFLALMAAQLMRG